MDFVSEIKGGNVPKEFIQKEYEKHVQAYASYVNPDDRKKYYYNLRDTYALHPQLMNPIEQAAALFYMLKTGFNGVALVDFRLQFCLCLRLLPLLSRVPATTRGVAWLRLLSDGDLPVAP